MFGLTKANNSTDFAIQFKEALCLGIIGLMASRQIQYFPRSSQKGILIGTTLSFGACLYGYSSVNKKMIGIAGAIFCSVYLAKLLKGRAALSLEGGLMLGTIQLVAVFILDKSIPRAKKEKVECWDDLLNLSDPGTTFPLKKLDFIVQANKDTCEAFLRRQLAELVCSGPEALDALLEKIDVNIKLPRSIGGGTILHYVAFNQHPNSVALVEALAEKGADFNALSSNNNTPLLLVLWHSFRDLNLAKKIFNVSKEQADFNIQGTVEGLGDRVRGKNYTALHLAIAKGLELEFIKLLIEKTNLELEGVQKVKSPRF